MSSHTGKLRIVRREDADRLSEIYRPYVETTTVTLEVTAPDRTEFERRIDETVGIYPYVVYETNGRVIGYAYAHKFRPRDGYRFCAELSVYTDGSEKGVGRRLYAAVIELCRLCGLKNLYGVVVSPNPKSFALHKATGFELVATEHLAGYKLGRWVDIVTFEKLIDGLSERGVPNEPTRFDSLPSETVKTVLTKYEGSWE